MTYSTSKGLRALVFGASGVTGWGLVNTALSYPTPETFDQVIGLTNRPLSKEDAKFPDDARLKLYSGVNLSQSVEEIVKALKGIEAIERTTHVYFSAYVHEEQASTGAVDESGRKKQPNVDILVNTVKSIEELCPSLEFWTFQTGGKWYGFEYGSKIAWNAPLKESAPRLPPPFADTIFYYSQFDSMIELSRNKKWNFADIRPNAIVGFVPKPNSMNVAEPMAVFLSLWKGLNPSPDVPFPGTETSYTTLHSDISQDTLARFHIYTSLNPEKTSGRSFNITDEGAQSWEMVWPGICSYFGLNGVGPLEPGAGPLGEEWVKSQQPKWKDWISKNGLREDVLEATSWGFFTALLGPFSSVDIHLETTEARKIGWTETVNHVASYHTAFDRMRAAKIIPDNLLGVGDGGVVLNTR